MNGEESILNNLNQETNDLKQLVYLKYNLLVLFAVTVCVKLFCGFFVIGKLWNLIEGSK